MAKEFEKCRHRLGTIFVVVSDQYFVFDHAASRFTGSQAIGGPTLKSARDG
jgi:hypothetical protein